jgi:GT2 family glycosyltransferase
VIAIIVAHDSAAVLPACLESLAREGVKAILVDNASGDASATMAERAGVAVIRNARNEGYGRALNIGLRAAGQLTSAEEKPSAYCLLLNPDLVLNQGTVAALDRAAKAYPDAGILAPRIVEPDGRLFFQARTLLAPYLKNMRGVPCLPQGDCCAPFLSGACLLVDRELVLSLGGFDENIFLFFEDDDLCRRVILSGRSLVHVHGAVARHLRGRSSAPERGRVFKARWHLAWSAGYVARKHHVANPSWRTMLVNASKFALAALIANRRLMERYGGSASGAMAELLGRGALDREGLS